MASITSVFDPSSLDDPYRLEWHIHPQRGQFRRLARDVDRAIARYLFQEATIEIDTAGPANRISQCSTLLFNLGFCHGESVLLGDNLAGRMPVHLLFSTPMRCIGAAVSADGLEGQAYLAQCAVKLNDGQWHAVPPQIGTLAPALGGLSALASAPFMGAVASQDATIVEAWFDVIDPGNTIDFSQVAISDLFFLPA
jgi:hypothetical protein